MKLLILASALSLASCAAVPPPPPQGPVGSMECGIIGSSDWAAWVNAMPGPNARPTLIVTGKVTVPTGGYRFQWRDMRVMESYPVQVAVELDAIPPAGGATEAVVTHDVRGQWPIDPPVGSLSVRCGDMVLTRIAPVETAH
ncbi:hypothetical protein [Sphingomonas sp.]|uniref:hypothetical protein n=1 Tax=Sphingomonas sp. TaxID=28214 RepID=UPI001826D217|nr:hypothetical protein [Sphingomonas sp.]MBA3512003.1 hypothetical protein [Sphingomonas sp.]